MVPPLKNQDRWEQAEGLASLSLTMSLSVRKLGSSGTNKQLHEEPADHMEFKGHFPLWKPTDRQFIKKAD